MINKYISDENLSKLCAKGAIQNLLNMLHFLPEDMNIFRELVTSPHEIMEWDIRSQGCFITKFRNRFNSEVPVDSM